MYLGILCENLKANADKLNIKDDSVIYQNNVPKHCACIIVQKSLHPLQSPDLNVIENLCV